MSVRCRNGSNWQARKDDLTPASDSSRKAYHMSAPTES